MINTIYVERAARQYARTDRILSRFPRARVIECDRYAELFNRAGQNFRLQKSNPALILAEKQGEYVLEAPLEYSVGGQHNYYFSHMLNCVYDCRYCFLQGMYRSANYVLFVNYESFMQAIAKITAKHGGEPAWFFSGYDCDSLALEPVTRFAGEFLPFFEDTENAWLELRTKSTQVRALREFKPIPRVVCAFSFTSEAPARAFEHKVPAVNKRIQAMAALQNQGWKVALRFDPLILHRDWQAHFEDLCQRIFSQVNPRLVHSVCIGTFRVPADYFRQMRRLYPEEQLFIAGVTEEAGAFGYTGEVDRCMRDDAGSILSRWLSVEQIFEMKHD